MNMRELFKKASKKKDELGLTDEEASQVVTVMMESFTLNDAQEEFFEYLLKEFEKTDIN